MTLAKVVGITTDVRETVLLAGAVGVPWTKLTALVATPVMVSNTTCGTVTAVLMTTTVDEPGMVTPAEGPSVSTQGTVTVVWSWMVVTGTVMMGVAVMVRVVASVMIAGFSGM
jgi:hypothetical protein